MQECQKEQKAGWSTIKERINSNKELIETVKNKVQEGNLKLRTLPTGALTDLHWANLSPCPGLGWVLGGGGVKGGDSRGTVLPEHRV